MVPTVAAVAKCLLNAESLVIWSWAAVQADNDHWPVTLTTAERWAVRLAEYLLQHLVQCLWHKINTSPIKFTYGYGVAIVENAEPSGFELNVNCQHSSLIYYVACLTLNAMHTATSFFVNMTEVSNNQQTVLKTVKYTSHMLSLHVQPTATPHWF